MHALYKPHSNVFVAHLFSFPFSLILSLSRLVNSYSLLLRLSKCRKLKFIVSWVSECLLGLLSSVTFFPISRLLQKDVHQHCLFFLFSRWEQYESCLGMLSL